jgi:transposase
MNRASLNFIEQLVVTEVKEQLRNLPPSFRKYRSELKSERLIHNAIQLLPRNFKILGEQYHDSQTRKLKVRIAVERAIADMLHELKFYYIVRTEVEDEEDIPTEPYSAKK